MSVVVVLFLFDEQAFQQAVRPVMADFVPGSRMSAVVTLLRRAAEGSSAETAGDAQAGLQRILREMEKDRAGRAEGEDPPTVYQLYSGRAHPGLEDAKQKARYVLEELEGESLPQNTHSWLTWMATKALVENYCIPWSRVSEPVFQMSGSAGESYILEHGENAGTLQIGGEVVQLGDWNLLLLGRSEAEAWAAKLRRWGPPTAARQRADYERLLALFDEASKPGGLRLAVAAE
jgi:hypothetical protein